MEPTICRCGHDPAKSSQHPCHGKGYTCGRPATRRFYNPRPPGQYASLAGMQMKIEVTESWACDDCWAAFSVMLKDQAEGLGSKT